MNSVTIVRVFTGLSEYHAQRYLDYAGNDVTEAIRRYFNSVQQRRFGLRLEAKAIEFVEDLGFTLKRVEGEDRHYWEVGLPDYIKEVTGHTMAYGFSNYNVIKSPVEGYGVFRISFPMKTQFTPSDWAGYCVYVGSRRYSEWLIPGGEHHSSGDWPEKFPPPLQDSEWRGLVRAGVLTPAEASSWVKASKEESELNMAMIGFKGGLPYHYKD